MTIFKQYSVLNKHIYILAFVKFINSLCNFVIPFLSLYCISTLKLSIWAVGVIVAISNVISIVAILAGGILSKIIKDKKLFMVLTYLFAAFFYIAVIFMDNIVFKVGCIMIGFGLVSLDVPIIDYFVGYYSSRSNSKCAFSLMYLCHNIAIGIGSVFSGVLFSVNANLIFVLNAASIIICAVIVALFFNYKFRDIVLENVSIKVNDKLMTGLTTYKRIFLVVMFIYAIAYAQVNFLLPIFLDAEKVNGASQLYGILMSINALTVVVFTPLVTEFSNKIYSTVTLLIAGILFMLGYMGYNVSLKLIILGIATIIWSLGEIFCSINHMPLLIEFAHADDIGVCSAYANIANRLGTVVSSLIGAGLISLYGFTYIWYIIGVVVLLGILLMIVVHKKYLVMKGNENG